MHILFIVFLVSVCLMPFGMKWADAPGQPADDWSRTFWVLLGAAVVAASFALWLLGLIGHYLFGWPHGV